MSAPHTVPENSSDVGCDEWDTSASEIMMKPECQRQFSCYKQGFAWMVWSG